MSEQVKFNIFSTVSNFARVLIEIFISLYLFKKGFSIKSILLFYFLKNIFAVFLAYIFVKIGEKYGYIYNMILGLIAFIIVQLYLIKPVESFMYIFILAILYAIYRKGYWVARRFYITNVMPTKKSSNKFSIVIVLSQISAIFAGYTGAFILDKFDMTILMLISSSLLLLSVIPLSMIKVEKKHTKIELVKNLKKYDKSNYLVFTLFELGNLLTLIFPIYIAIYIDSSYILASSLSAVSNIATMIIVLLYGKIINKNKNYLVLSTILLLTLYILKASILTKIIIVIYFFEGVFKNIQNQSVNKVYFENRNDMDIVHYNLIYQIIESAIRVLVIVPLFFINEIRIMILFVMAVIALELLIYCFLKYKEKTI